MGGCINIHCRLFLKPASGGVYIKGGTTAAKPAVDTAKHHKGRESLLQRDCEQWLQLHGIEYLHISPMGREKKGWPDLTFAVNGQAVGVELKTATGKLSEDQEDCHARLRANGWEVAVCRSLGEMRELVERLDYGDDYKENKR
jgi:hypothetical protein